MSLLYEALYLCISLCSRGINKIVFRGDPDTTLSARCYIEGTKNTEWAERRDQIDRVFLLLGDVLHCQRSWEHEVANAYNTLRKEDERLSNL